MNGPKSLTLNERSDYVMNLIGLFFPSFASVSVALARTDTEAKLKVNFSLQVRNSLTIKFLSTPGIGFEESSPSR
jgi:hypothetical protein